MAMSKNVAISLLFSDLSNEIRDIIPCNALTIAKNVILGIPHLIEIFSLGCLI